MIFLVHFQFWSLSYVMFINLVFDYCMSFTLQVFVPFFNYILYLLSQQVQLSVHQLTAAPMVVVRMQSAYVKELHLCAAVCLEQQAGLRLSATQVGQGTHYSFNNIVYTGLVTTLCFICSAEMVVLYLFHKVLQPRSSNQNFGFLVTFKLYNVGYNVRSLY